MEYEISQERNSDIVVEYKDGVIVINQRVNRIILEECNLQQLENAIKIIKQLKSK